MFSFTEWARKQPGSDGHDELGWGASSCAPVTCQIMVEELTNSVALKQLGFDVDRRRHSELKRKYGMSLQDYYLRWLRQACACAICRTEPKGLLFVDHCHVTGQLRGLLCRKCNMAVGFFRDDPLLARAATAYLEAARKRIRRMPRPCPQWLEGSDDSVAGVSRVRKQTEVLPTPIR